MTTDNKTDIQTAESKPEIIIVKEKSKLGLAITALITGFYAFFAGAFLMLFLIAQYPNIFGNMTLSYAILFSIPTIIVIFAFSRNYLLRRRLRVKGHKSYLEFTYIFRKLVYILVLTLVIAYSINGISDSKFFLLALFSFFAFMPFKMIFDDGLTEDGEITILFELLQPPIRDFHNARRYWKKVAQKVEDKLSEANISLSSKDLVYQFGKKLLVTDDDKEISDNLICIREWLLGRQRSCYDGLWWLNRKWNCLKRRIISCSNGSMSIQTK